MPIPVYFAYERYIKQEADPTGQEKPPLDTPLRDFFDTLDLAMMDDSIVNGKMQPPPEAPSPLALFREARIDYSLQGLLHYTGTSLEHFQNYVIFTNY